LDDIPEYIDGVVRLLLVDGVRQQAEEILRGVDDVFPSASLRAFTPNELRALLCGEQDADWQEEAITKNIVCKHGYTSSSVHVQRLVAVMSSFDRDQRRLFLRFVTGASRLPNGGFGALVPNRLTVVKKQVESRTGGEVTQANIDAQLPSCSTCQVYLKLPAYSSEDVLRSKLVQAITEGQEHFALD
jgi:E3 ubiquitin-protein ligase TRIP12